MCVCIDSTLCSEEQSLWSKSPRSEPASPPASSGGAGYQGDVRPDTAYARHHDHYQLYSPLPFVHHELHCHQNIYKTTGYPDQLRVLPFDCRELNGSCKGGVSVSAAGAAVVGDVPGQLGGVPVVRVVKRRNTANKKERRRTQSINAAFQDLRDRIPNVPADTKLSKVERTST